MSIERQLTKHFNLKEFQCRDGSQIPDEHISHIGTLAIQLEVLRTVCGNNPITIISGHRSQAYNTRCGGSPRSQHLVSRAVDVRVKNVDCVDVAAKVIELMDKGLILQGGVGLYRDQNFTHIDTRGHFVTWGF